MTIVKRIFIILQMPNSFTGSSYSDVVLKAYSKGLTGRIRFNLLKFIALKGECRITQIPSEFSGQDESVYDLLEDMANDFLIRKQGNNGEFFYSINPDMFLSVLDEMSLNAKKCIEDSDNLLLHSRVITL